MPKRWIESSHEHGIRALRAIGLLGDRGAMNTAIENLQTRDPAQRANVLEALELISAQYRSLLQPLMRLWEDEGLQRRKRIGSACSTTLTNGCGNAPNMQKVLEITLWIRSLLYP